MNLKAIQELNKLHDVLRKAAKMWRASYNLEVVADLRMEEEDTSSSAELNYVAGTVTQLVRPRVLVEYSIFQIEEENGHLGIDMPTIPTTRIEAKARHIAFHRAALTSMLVDYGPREADWKQAQEECAGGICEEGDGKKKEGIACNGQR